MRNVEAVVINDTLIKKANAMHWPCYLNLEVNSLNTSRLETIFSFSVVETTIKIVRARFIVFST